MKNPFISAGQSELIWDGDLRPEGLATKMVWLKVPFKFFTTAAVHWVEERASSEDSKLFGFQGSIRYAPESNKTHLMFGLGYFLYDKIQGFKPFFDGEDSFGNRLDTNGNYASKFSLLELGGEFKVMIHEVPALFFGDFVRNVAVDGNNEGWLIGIKVGKRKQVGSWELRTNYRWIEKDAVVGVFTDSDFLGGGTDGKGVELGGTAQIGFNITIGVSYFINQKGLDNTSIDYKRMQVDLKLKF